MSPNKILISLNKNLILSNQNLINILFLSNIYNIILLLWICYQKPIIFEEDRKKTSSTFGEGIAMENRHSLCFVEIFVLYQRDSYEPNDLSKSKKLETKTTYVERSDSKSYF